MHIPDGYLGPVTYGGLWAAMLPVWAYASRKVKQSLETAQVPFLAMASVFSLVAMVFAIPLPGGTTGHLNGSTLVAILLGPWPAILAISVALAIQALVFGEGGITALGANCFNIAFLGSITGYGLYRFISAFRFIPKAAAAGIASYLSLNLSGLITAIELGLQPMIHSTTSSYSYFPFSLPIALPAIMIPHLTILGLIEATITVLVMLVILKSQPGWLNRQKKSIVFLLTLFFIFLPSSGRGHDFWIEKKGSDLMLVFGHGEKREEFDPIKVKTIRALDNNGTEIEVKMEKRSSGLLLRTDQPPSLLYAEIDNGYWSKTIYGWKNLPKRKASRVVESNRSFFYSKTLLSWSEPASRPFVNSGLEIIPLENPFELKTGAFLHVRVLYQGKPLSGVDVEGGDHQKLSTTDKEGMAKFQIKKGYQLISVSLREPLKHDPDADFLSITSTLTFEVTK
jgi:cobalt/nickel transport system permease protein